LYSVCIDADQHVFELGSSWNLKLLIPVVKIV
jgi:hypothetical protein